MWFVGAATHCFQLGDNSSIVPDPGESLGGKDTVPTLQEASSLDF